MSQALYDAVKSGRVKLDSLNSDGVDALRNYMDDKVTPGGSIDSIQSDQRKTEQAAAFTPQPFNNDPIEAQPVQQNKPSFLDKIFKDNPIARVLNYPFAKAAQDSVPDANYFGTNVNAKQDFAQRNPILSTGSPTLDKIGDFAGGIGSMFTPIGTGGALVNDAGKISSGLLGTKAGQWLDNAAGKLGANAADFANPVLNQAGINLSTDLAQKAGQGLLRGAALGAAYGAVQPLATGSGQLSDVPQNMLENAAMFAGGDALLPFAGAGIGKIGELLKKDAPLPDYSNVSLSQGKGIDNPIKPMDTGNITPEQILNSDAKQPEPIKLTPAEIARNERIDKFSKIEDNPVIPNTADQIQSKTGKDSTSFSTKANQAYINTVDNLHRTNQFDQTAKEANGGTLNPSDSAYTLSLNARGHDMQASQIVNKNMINAQGEVTGQSLADITKQIPKGQEQAFKDYVVAQHAIDRMGRGEQVYSDDKNMTIQKAKEIVDQYNGTNPEFKNIQQQYTKFHQDFAQQWYVDTGLFKQEQINKAFEDNPNYVPNKRIFSDLEKKTPFGNSKGGAVGQSNPVKRYDEAGSKRPIVDPIESSIEDVAKGVKTAKNNEAGQAILRSLRRNPEELAGFARIVGKDTELNVDEMIQKDGVESVIDHINKTFEDATKNHNPEKGNIVTVLEHGEPIKIEVYDPQFLEAISNLSPKGQDYATAAVGRATKVMKTLTTGVNPVFGLTRNISRDIPHAFISSKTTNNPVRFGVDLLDAVTSVLADSVSHSKLTPDFMKGWLETRGSLYNDYKNMGGGHSSPISADRDLLAQSKKKLLQPPGIKESTKQFVKGMVTKPFKTIGNTKAFHILENVNNAAEAAPRLGEYKRTIQQGLDQGKGLYDSKVKALYEANDVTTNFNKFGNVTKNADAYLPYLNAAVQGLDQLVRMGTQGGAKRLTAVYGKAIGALTIPTTVLYLINHNNPDYQQVSNFIKDNYLLIPNGDGTFKKIAKPRELGMVFSTGVERALRAFADHDPRAFQDFGTAFLKNFLPPGAGGAVDGFNQKGIAGIPGGALQDTIAGPLMDLERNKNFANQPIVPQDLLNLSPRNQYDAKTSEPAKFIGNLLNSSPKQLDFLAKSYLGVIGQLGIPATTKGGSIGDTLKQQVNVDPVYSNDISSNFYNQKNKEDMAKADAKFNGVPQQDMSAYYDKLATQFSKVRNQMKMIQKDDTISNTDKQAKLKDLQVNLNQIQKNATR